MSILPLSLDELENPSALAHQMRIEANRLASAFAHCTDEKNAARGCEPAPIWQTIRDLNRLADAVYAAHAVSYTISPGPGRHSKCCIYDSAGKRVEQDLTLEQAKKWVADKGAPVAPDYAPNLSGF